LNVMSSVYIHLYIMYYFKLHIFNKMEEKEEKKEEKNSPLGVILKGGGETKSGHNCLKG
jgi:hypothetical protein